MTKLQVMIVLAIAFTLGLAGAVWLWGPYGLFGGCGVLVVSTLFMNVKEGSRA